MNYSRIAEERKKLGLNQEQLATRLKISQKSISKYERGDRRPSYETLVAMSSVFGVSVDYLLGVTDNPNEKSGTDKVSVAPDGEYFYFFFNEDSLLRSTFSKRVKTAIADAGMTMDKFKEEISLDSEKVDSLLAGSSDPTASDLIELSQTLNTSIDYLLGQVPKVSNAEKKLLNAFVKLSEDNQDIIIGKAKELLKEQRYEESVAADEQLKEAK